MPLVPLQKERLGFGLLWYEEYKSGTITPRLLSSGTIASNQTEMPGGNKPCTSCSWYITGIRGIRISEGKPTSLDLD